MEGYDKNTYNAILGDGTIKGAWCVWFLRLCSNQVGVGNLFSTSNDVENFSIEMLNKYGAQGYYLTDSSQLTQYAKDKLADAGAQAVMSASFTPQSGDIYIMRESDSYKFGNHVGFVTDFVNGTIHIVAGNNGSNGWEKNKVECRNSSSNYYYKLSNVKGGKCPVVAFIRPNYASIDGSGITPTFTLPAAMSSTTSAQAQTNIVSYGKQLVGYNRGTFQAAGCTDIPSGDWNTWFLKLCGKQVGVDGLFSAKTQASEFCTDMIQNYGAKGYYYTDTKWITDQDKAALNGSQAVTKSTFTPQIGDIYILNESGSGYMNQVGFVADVVNGSVYALVGNNGTAQEVQYRASTTNYFYQISNEACPIIGYIRPNYALLDGAVDNEPPKISDARVVDRDGEGYTLSCTVTDNVGVTSVVFPTWTLNNGQDDLQQPWPAYTSRNGDTYLFRVNISDHNNEYGKYATHIYAYDAAGNNVFVEVIETLEAPHTHSGTLVAAKPSTCTDYGNVAYYVCACGAWFADSACNNVITDSREVMTAPLGHNFIGTYEYVDYAEHMSVCANGCGTKQRETHTDADNDKICDLCKGETVEPSKKGLHVTLANPNVSFVYTGKAVTPEIIVENNGEALTPGIDYTVKYTNNKDASITKPEKSKPRITVTGKNNLSGSTYTTFDIQPKNIGDSDVAAGNLLVAAGSKAVPSLVYRSEKLSSKDITVEDAQKKFTEDGELRVTGKGNYTGSRTIPVRVVQKSAMKKFSVTLGPEKLVYNGSEQRLSFSVLDSSTKEALRENTDYQVIYSGNLTDAGTVKFSVIGMGEYTGTVVKSYKISPLAVKSGISVKGINTAGYPYSSKGVTIGKDITVSYGAMVLKEGRDYRISYSGNRKVSTAKSTAKYTISFIGNYKGSAALKGTFSIYASEVSHTTPGLEVIMPDKIYTGKAGAYQSTPYIMVSKALLKKTDYTVKYYKDAAMTQEIKGRANQISLRSDEEYATIYAKIVFKGNYSSVNGQDGYVAASYKVYNKKLYQDLSKARVTFVDASGKAIKKSEYTGRAITPKVKLEFKGDKGYVEVPSDQYKVVYVNNVNKGTATAIITGTGRSYGGSKIATFQIASKNVRSLADFWSGLFGWSNS
ncbi:MAG: GBS Bsp-like repeat-containing protein [Butyrivibrio sp.]|nr:GBS Bsp-like repeat-containing protein [Muribaculum sp.]MCM1553324.1 GBS Bsp-like repeat-containing protein [Butyrivibrio sp.]